MTRGDRDLIKSVKEMRGRQMRKRYKQTMRRKSSIPSVDVHVANNNLVFSCYICICCLKLQQADYHVEEFLIIPILTFWWGGGGGGGVGWWCSCLSSVRVPMYFSGII